MRVCTFLAADVPLPPHAPSQAYSLCIDVEHETVYDGADDNFFLYDFADALQYSGKQYGVCLVWEYTEGRANKMIEYIKTALQQTETVELWHVWLMDSYRHMIVCVLFGSFLCADSRGREKARTENRLH